MLKEDVKNLDTKIDNLDHNIQSDIKNLGELIVKMISNLPDKHYLNDKIADTMGDNIIRHKKVIKSSKHITSVVGRHHNKTKADIKDKVNSEGRESALGYILVAKEKLNSI